MFYLLTHHCTRMKYVILFDLVVFNHCTRYIDRGYNYFILVVFKELLFYYRVKNLLWYVRLVIVAHGHQNRLPITIGLVLSWLVVSFLDLIALLPSRQTVCEHGHKTMFDWLILFSKKLLHNGTFLVVSLSKQAARGYFVKSVTIFGDTSRSSK